MSKLQLLATHVTGIRLLLVHHGLRILNASNCYWILGRRERVNRIQIRRR